MTRFLLSAQDMKIPEIQRYITVAQEVFDEIDGGNRDKAVSLVKALMGVYEKVEGEEDGFLRTLNGHKFYLNFRNPDKALDEIFKDFSLHGEYEPHTTKLFESIIKPGMNCVDIGASIGYFTLLLARLVGETGKVYAVEPTQNQFPVLKRNIEVNGYKDRVEALNYAAWDESGFEVNIQTNKGETGIMTGIKIDDILPVGKGIDFIKIDTDGSEPHVLKGLLGTIEKNPNLQMIIEYYPKYIENMGGDPKEVLAILDKYFTYEKIEGDYTEDYYNIFCKRK